MQIGNRIIRKRIHVRIEHVTPSRCREEFLKRQAANDQIKHEAKERGGAGPSRCLSSRTLVCGSRRAGLVATCCQCCLTSLSGSFLLHMRSRLGAGEHACMMFLFEHSPSHFPTAAMFCWGDAG